MTEFKDRKKREKEREKKIGGGKENIRCQYRKTREGKSEVTLILFFVPQTCIELTEHHLLHWACRQILNKRKTQGCAVKIIVHCGISNGLSRCVNGLLQVPYCRSVVCIKLLSS